MKYEIPKEQIGKYDGYYLSGGQNRIIRYYFYLARGLDVLNQFRNLFLGIIALYIALHLTNLAWMVAMFIPSLLILIVVGYYSVHTISKVTEWLNVRFGTHYGIKQFNYTEDQIKLLKEIRDLLKNGDK